MRAGKGLVTAVASALLLALGLMPGPAIAAEVEAMATPGANPEAMVVEMDSANGAASPQANSVSPESAVVTADSGVIAVSGDGDDADSDVVADAGVVPAGETGSQDGVEGEVVPADDAVDGTDDGVADTMAPVGITGPSTGAMVSAPWSSAASSLDEGSTPARRSVRHALLRAAATPDSTTLTGTAYAVLDGSGTLNFVRSTETHANGDTGTVSSISGNTYTGTIYTGFEDNGTWYDVDTTNRS